MKGITKGAVLLAVILCTMCVGGFAQQKSRVIDESNPTFTYKNTPVSVVDRQFAGKPFSRGSVVNGDVDWLSEVTFGIKNNSNKSIVYLHLELVIENQSGIPRGSQVAIPVTWGSSTAPAEKSPIDRSLVPGEVARLSLPADAMEYWKRILAKYGAADFDRVSLEIRHVHYEDGSGWAVGVDVRQDPEDPGRWRAVPKNKKGKTNRVIYEVTPFCQTHCDRPAPDAGWWDGLGVCFLTTERDLGLL